MNKEAHKSLAALLEGYDNIVFFGGAGVSTESGIPDFRGSGGLFGYQYEHPPETMLSHSFFKARPEEFYRFYRDKMLYLDAKPNPAHMRLAELERQGRLRAVITQNIDGLHTLGGSQNVLELHGSVHRNYCLRCGKTNSARFMLESRGVPVCECGGTIRPDVVLYEEGLSDDVLQKAVAYISQAQVLIVGGTSLVVYPAAGLITYFGGDKLILINKTETSFDRHADIVIREGIGFALGENFSKPITQ